MLLLCVLFYRGWGAKPVPGVSSSGVILPPKPCGPASMTCSH